MSELSSDLFGRIKYEQGFWRGATSIQIFTEVQIIILSVDGREVGEGVKIENEVVEEVWYQDIVL
ncbi:hypothetical protein N781_08855 [Pontibacillus halophilus JSM 076056 = DSM 19796]|uniref:Uncharacterized protein n=1 Tax=Pontibacillus halophilus JSM 076056 = DSM 19796 TaxID=1385510 RepID=A0A0A5GFX8_9BACI|nr:hypothetical protein [Pontibacillus halophilus]KGX89990.1 hypothetical protein N781_08855 [Pontibacillus halophilus JSM 076056 = DSM 19796]